MAKDKFESQYILELADILTRNLNFKVDATMKEVASVLGTLSRQEQNTYLREAALASRQPMNLGSLRHQFGNDTKTIVKVMYDREKQASKSLAVNQPSMGMYISKGQLTQARDTFIKKLVTSLAQLPFFQTLGKAATGFAKNLAILGTINTVQGLASFNPVQFVTGLGELIVSAITAAIPLILSIWVQQLITNTATTLRYTIKFLVGIGKLVGQLFSGIWGLITKVFTGIWGFVVKVIASMNTVLGFLKVLGGITGVITGILSIFKGFSLFKGGKKGQGLAVMGTGLVAVIAGALAIAFAPVTGPIAGIASAVAFVAGAISHIIANWDAIIGWVSNIFYHLPKWMGGKGGGTEEEKEKRQAAKAQKENTQLSAAPKASKEVVESIVKNGPFKPNDLTGHAEASRYGGNIVFGTRKSQAGKINWGKKDRADIIAGIASGKYSQLESLQGGGAGWKIDQGSFVNDVAAARAGTGAILSAVAAQMPGQNIVITSALGTKQSKKNKIHSGGDKGTGHYEGQTIDISAAGMTKAQAKDYAKRMYATGYFSHVAAERGKDGQYHLDARIADEAYKTFENATAESKKFEKDVDRAIKPSSQLIVPAPPGNNTLSYLKFGERSGEFGQRSLC